MATHRYRKCYYKGGGRGRYFLRAEAAAAIFKGQGCGRYFLRAEAAAAIFKGQGLRPLFFKDQGCDLYFGLLFPAVFLCANYILYLLKRQQYSDALRLNFGGTSAELRRNFGGTSAELSLAMCPFFFLLVLSQCLCILLQLVRVTVCPTCHNMWHTMLHIQDLQNNLMVDTQNYKTHITTYVYV